MRESKLINLLNDTCETYYWIGFLLADGSFGNNRLTVRVALKDKVHLLKFKIFLNINKLDYIKSNGFDQVGISIMDNDVLNIIGDKFNIHSNKTKNPSDLSGINEDLMTSLIIGFIDGDGSITNQTDRSDCSLRVQVYHTWLDNLNLFLKYISPDTKAKINNSGYAYFSITNSIILKKIKQKAINLNLPILNRKWDKIDLSLIGRTENSEKNKLMIIELLKEGKSQKYICETLKIKPSALSLIIKRNNYKKYKLKSYE